MNGTIREANYLTRPSDEKGRLSTYLHLAVDIGDSCGREHWYYLVGYANNWTPSGDGSRLIDVPYAASRNNSKSAFRILVHHLKHGGGIEWELMSFYTTQRGTKVPYYDCEVLIGRSFNFNTIRYCGQVIGLPVPVVLENERPKTKPDYLDPLYNGPVISYNLSPGLQRELEDILNAN